MRWLLISALDVIRQPILLTMGDHDFTYQIYADGFEIYEFTIRLSLTGAFDDLQNPKFVSR